MSLAVMRHPPPLVLADGACRKTQRIAVCSLAAIVPHRHDSDTVAAGRRCINDCSPQEAQGGEVRVRL